MLNYILSVMLYIWNRPRASKIPDHTSLKAINRLVEALLLSHYHHIILSSPPQWAVSWSLGPSCKLQASRLLTFISEFLNRPKYSEPLVLSRTLNNVICNTLSWAFVTFLRAAVTLIYTRVWGITVLGIRCAQLPYTHTFHQTCDGSA
jgi:hypothetical protein